MKKQIIATLSIAAVALLAACSNGSEPAAAVAGPNSEARVTAFKSMMPSFSTMGKMVKGEESYDVEKFKEAAATFATDSQKPFEHFTQDGENQNGNALPSVWAEPEKFKTAEVNFHEAVTKLSESAQTGNFEDIKVSYGNVGATCKACHDSFKKPSN